MTYTTTDIALVLALSDATLEDGSFQVHHSSIHLYIRQAIRKFLTKLWISGMYHFLFVQCWLAMHLELHASGNIFLGHSRLARKLFFSRQSKK